MPSLRTQEWGWGDSRPRLTGRAQSDRGGFDPVGNRFSGGARQLFGIFPTLSAMVVMAGNRRVGNSMVFSMT